MAKALGGCGERVTQAARSHTKRFHAKHGSCHVALEGMLIDRLGKPSLLFPSSFCTAYFFSSTAFFTSAASVFNNSATLIETRLAKSPLGSRDETVSRVVP